MKTRTTIILAFLGLSLLGGANYYDTIYVQNETFDGENKVFAKNIIIGKDVTSTKPEGPVVVSSGTTSFTGNNIVIRNNFEVTSGASLRVGN